MSSGSHVPRIFISCVSDEFRTLRKMVAEAVRHLGCEPVFMEAWPTANGDLLSWHCKEIDSCDGLIQITGIAYGEEPPGFPPFFHGQLLSPPRYSYTQFEFLYASSRGMKTWIILPGDSCTRDTHPDFLDLPKNRNPAGPADIGSESARFQKTRRDLQAFYIQYLKERNHIRHSPADDKDLQILILKLRNHPEELRTDLFRWQKSVSLGLERMEEHASHLNRETSLIRRYLPLASLTLILTLAVLFYIRSNTSHISSIVEDIKTDQQIQNDLLGKQTNLLKEAVVQLDKLTEEKSKLGVKISDLSRQEVEKELAARMNISAAELRLHIEAGKKSEDSLVRARAYLLAGNSEDAISAADEVEKNEARALDRLIEALQIKATAQYSLAAFKEALAVRERIVGLIDRDTRPLAWAAARYEVAYILSTLSDYSEAEKILREVIAIEEKQLAPDDFSLAMSYNDLGEACRLQGRLDEAEPLFRRAIAIDEKHFGPNHQAVAIDINNLAVVLGDQDQPEQAEALLRRALAINETTGGPDNPAVAVNLNNLATILESQGKLSAAGPLYRRAIQIDEKAFPENHPTIALDLRNLAFLLVDQGEHQEAGQLFRRALVIDEAVFGLDSSEVAADLSNLAGSLKSQGIFPEAEALYRRAIDITRQTLGPDDPLLSTRLHGLARVLVAQKRFDEAEPLYLQSMEIDRKRSGETGPEYAIGLSSLAELYEFQGKLDQAEPLYRQAIGIGEATLEPDAATLATRYNNLACLLRTRGRLAEAAVLFRRALGAEFHRAAGEGRPFEYTGKIWENYRDILARTGKDPAGIDDEVIKLKQESGYK